MMTDRCALCFAPSITSSSTELSALLNCCVFKFKFLLLYRLNSVKGNGKGGSSLPPSQLLRDSPASLLVPLTNIQRTRAAAEMLPRTFSAITWPAIGDNGCGVQNAAEDEEEEIEEGAGEKDEAEERKASKRP